MADVQDTGPLDWRIAIVDKAGRPTQEFQRRWSTQRSNNSLIGGVTFGSGPPTTTPGDGDEYIDTSTTPYTLYTGNGGSWHKVGPTEFTELSDTPASYTGKSKQLVRVNTGETALEFHPEAFLDLADTPSTYTGSGLKIVRVNTGATALEFVDPTTPLSAVGFVVLTGATGTNVGPMLLAPKAGSLVRCTVITKTSDPTTALTFTIKKNGSTIFTSSPTITAATSPGTVSTFTTLTTNPLPVALNDVFTLDITSGTSSWTATIQLES